jgi:hypothetical protein
VLAKASVQHSSRISSWKTQTNARQLVFNTSPLTSWKLLLVVS